MKDFLNTNIVQRIQIKEAYQYINGCILNIKTVAIFYIKKLMNVKIIVGKRENSIGLIIIKN